MGGNGVAPPLAIDLFCGMGGWTIGLQAAGWRVIGFDIERHQYWLPEELPDGDGLKGTRPLEKRGWTQGCAVSLGMEGSGARPRTRQVGYPGELVLQDVLTLDGKQFKGRASLIVASPPCQAYSYRAMPWKRAKALPPPSNELFDACFRIAREAECPIVVENVCGAQKWVGRAAWHYGSYYLWGDVPALMPHTLRVVKREGRNFHGPERGESSPSFNGGEHETRGVKGAAPVGTAKSPGTGGTSWFFGTRCDPRDMRRNEDGEFTRLGIKQHGSGQECFDNGIAAASSRSDARKAASALIAMIPFDLACWIGQCFYPRETPGYCIRTPLGL